MVFVFLSPRLDFLKLVLWRVPLVLNPLKKCYVLNKKQNVDMIQKVEMVLEYSHT